MNEPSDWKFGTVKFVCACHDEELPHMDPQLSGRGIEYRCPCCVNMISEYEAEKAKSDLVLQETKAIRARKVKNFQGYTWKSKAAVEYKIKNYDPPDDITIMVKNIAELRKHGMG